MTGRNQLIVAALLELEAKLEGEGWDQPAWPFYVVSSDPFGRQMQTMELPVDMTPWLSRDRPYRVLDALARATTAGLGIPMPSAMTVQAVGFHSEAWMVRAKHGDVAGWDQARAASRDRKIHRQADKQEIRFVVAVDRDRRDYFVQRTRGEPPEVWAGLGDGEAQLQGSAVRDSLRAYAATVFGWGTA